MVQAALTGLDTWMSKKWREKQRRWRQQRADWRAEDIQFRFEEILLREEEQDFFQAQLRWREEDMKQRKVGNSRYLWNRFSEKNRRDVEEKSEQLRSISWLSGLVTSFTMTSPIEFAFVSQSISIAKLTSYAIFAAIVPTLMITSTIICVYLLGRILKMGKMFVAEHVEDVFMKQCCLFAESNGTLQTPPKPRRTFERFWDIRCENDWEKAFSLFFWGIGSFLALLCTMGFIKFSFANGVAILFSAIIGVVFFIWERNQVADQLSKEATQLTWGQWLINEQDGPEEYQYYHRPFIEDADVFGELNVLATRSLALYTHFLVECIDFYFASRVSRVESRFKKSTHLQNNVRQKFDEKHYISLLNPITMLGAQLTWGTYLRKTQPNRPSVLNV